MTTAFSTWGSVPDTGPYVDADWKDAGVLEIPDAVVLLKNDADYLYLALELPGDTVHSAGKHDYFLIDFDVDRDGVITPGTDVSYGVLPDLPIRLARRHYLGPDRWTPTLIDPSPSSCRRAFTASARIPVPHTVWLLRLSLAELGLPSLVAATPPMVRFGLCAAWGFPPKVVRSPDDFTRDFRSLHEVALAIGTDAAPSTGLLTSIGNIPVDAITGGRATTSPQYRPSTAGAAFAGTLNFVARGSAVADLWRRGARRFVLERRGPAEQSHQPVRTTWCNYLRTPSGLKLVGFAPDERDSYPLPSPSDEYATKDLLCQIRTAVLALPVGQHSFRALFFRADGRPVKYKADAAAAELVTLFIDNRQPIVAFHGVRYGENWESGEDLLPCSITSVTADGSIFVRLEASDPEENLAHYTLSASYGTDQQIILCTESAPHPWSGDADRILLLPSGFPPQTCAYQLRLAAWPNTTDGYRMEPVSAAATLGLTLVVPAGPPAPGPRASHRLPPPRGHPQDRPR